MKAKYLVAQIAKSKEYRELCQAYEAAVQQAMTMPAQNIPDQVFEEILKLQEKVRELLVITEDQFLEQITTSYRRSREAPGVFRVTGQGGIPNIRAGQQAFLHQVQQQMPVFGKLLDYPKTTQIQELTPT